MAVPQKSQALVDRVIDAHGGMDRWNKITSIEVTLNVSGSGPVRKGWPRRFHPTGIIDTKTTKVVWKNLIAGQPDKRWFYTPERVWIEQNGALIASRDNPYDAFVPHTRDTPWDELNLATFVGYAMHQYITLPFQLRWPGFESREVEPYSENGEAWRVLEVTFPEPRYYSHSKVQLFYFDKDFMLRRVDYSPVAFKMMAAHYCFDVEEVGGIKIPMLRRVVPRIPAEPVADGELVLGGRAWLSGPTSFLLDYHRVVVREEGHESVSGAKI